MDSLKTLMDKKQYDLVIDITENSSDANELFYRLSAFVAKGDLENGLNLIKKESEILRKGNLALLIKVHIDILCLLRNFDEAYEELNKYKELPYESQQVEEMLSFMSNYIRQTEKEAFRGAKELDEDQLLKDLNSTDQNVVMIALSNIMHQDITPYFPKLLELMRKPSLKKDLRTFVLFLLMDRKYDKEVEFLNHDALIKVNPSKLVAPFEKDSFKKLLKDLTIKFKNPTLSEAAVRIYSTYVIYLFPDDCQYEENIVLYALYSIVAKMFNDTSIDVEKECLENDIDINKVDDLVSEILEANEN